MSRTVPALAALLLLFPAHAGAVDLVASYRVEAKAFKKGVVAGDLLTFTLFSDAACTLALQQFAVLAEDLDAIEPKKLARVKKGPKPPKTTELQERLVNVVADALFLEVTGNGVVPVGDACQLQSVAGGGGVFASGQIREDGTIRSSSARVDAVTKPATGQYCVTLLGSPGQERLENAVVGLAGSSSAPGFVRLTNGQGSHSCPADSLIVLGLDELGNDADVRFSFIVP